jgi:hypothetical protein
VVKIKNSKLLHTQGGIAHRKAGLASQIGEEIIAAVREADSKRAEEAAAAEGDSERSVQFVYATHTHTHLYTHMCVREYIYIYIYIYIYTYIHTFVYIHAHTCIHGICV